MYAAGYLHEANACCTTVVCSINIDSAGTQNVCPACICSQFFIRFVSNPVTTANTFRF